MKKFIEVGQKPNSLLMSIDEEFKDRYMPTAHTISDWLYDHTQSYEDACNYFGCDVDEDIADYATDKELIAWIARYDQLARKFSAKFGPEWVEAVL